jgi:hypothetical protein
MEMKTDDLAKELIDKYKKKQSEYDKNRYLKLKSKLQEKYINNRTEMREKQKTYYNDNKDRYRQYYIKNADKIKEYTRNYKLQKKQENKSM